MKKDIIDLSRNLPLLNKTYAPLDVWNNTVGRYFDYKKETAMIHHATQQLKAETKIILKKIDSELQRELDRNDKSFKQEMLRLQTIANELNSGAVTRESICNHISELTRQLGDSAIPMSVKESIPQLIAMAHQQLSDERKSSMDKLNLMSGFEPNQKLIKGD
jgi:F0F1-type ATP synthase membrane subunit b/b'